MQRVPNLKYTHFPHGLHGAQHPLFFIQPIDI